MLVSRKRTAFQLVIRRKKIFRRMIAIKLLVTSFQSNIEKTLMLILGLQIWMDQMMLQKVYLIHDVSNRLVESGFQMAQQVLCTELLATTNKEFTTKETTTWLIGRATKQFFWARRHIGLSGKLKKFLGEKKKFLIFVNSIQKFKRQKKSIELSKQADIEQLE